MSDELTLSREDVSGLEVVRVEGEVDASGAHWTLVVAGFDRARVLPSVGEALLRVGPGTHGA